MGEIAIVSFDNFLEDLSQRSFNVKAHFAQIIHITKAFTDFYASNPSINDDPNIKDVFYPISSALQSFPEKIMGAAGILLFQQRTSMGQLVNLVSQMRPPPNEEFLKSLSTLHLFHLEQGLIIPYFNLDEFDDQSLREKIKFIDDATTILRNWMGKMQKAIADAATSAEKIKQPGTDLTGMLGGYFVFLEFQVGKYEEPLARGQLARENLQRLLDAINEYLIAAETVDLPSGSVGMGNAIIIEDSDDSIGNLQDEPILPLAPGSDDPGSADDQLSQPQAPADDGEFVLVEESDDHQPEQDDENNWEERIWVNEQESDPSNNDYRFEEISPENNNIAMEEEGPEDPNAGIWYYLNRRPFGSEPAMSEYVDIPGTAQLEDDIWEQSPEARQVQNPEFFGDVSSLGSPDYSVAGAEGPNQFPIPSPF